MSTRRDNTEQTTTEIDMTDNIIGDDGEAVSAIEPIYTTQTGVFAVNRLLHTWLMAEMNMASICLDAIYDGDNIAGYVDIVDMDDCFDSEQEVKTHLSEEYTPELWVNPPHGTFSVDWWFDADEIVGPDAICEDYFDAIWVECESWCEFYDDEYCKVAIVVKFVRKTETMEIFRRPVIVVEDADEQT